MSDDVVEQKFEARVSEVLHIVINSLYSHKEIFLRELISNASDALDRLRFKAIETPELMAEDERLRIQLIPDSEAGTLEIRDNGIGMSRDELAVNLGTIAHSGSKEFLKRLEAARQSGAESPTLIGQFGVGFYSGFLVADRVEVVSRAAGSDEAHRWSSDGREAFELGPAERSERGTSIILHLKKEHEEFLKPFRLRELVTRYSDYVGHAIELADDDEKEPEAINRARALWQRPQSDITDEQYAEFYKHLTRDFSDPIAHAHFKIEGTQMFTGLVFVPGRAPFDLFDPDATHGIRLHVRRVFVMDDCRELLPRWLRFVRGIIDSEDLPLNVSRETLQDSRVVRTIRKQVTTQTLSLLESLADEKPDDYRKVWDAFGPVLKEGLHFEAELRERIAKLMRYPSSKSDALVSLPEYVERMQEGQEGIYYATGPSLGVVKNSPHLERLASRGIEVLFMVDPVDPFAVDSLREFAGKPLIDAINADAPDHESDDANDEPPEELVPLLERFRVALGDRVGEVRPSKRLTDSPVCLVVASGGLQPHVARLLRAQQMEVPDPARVLEVNPDHALIRQLVKLEERGGNADKIAEWVKVLHDQALLVEGSPIDDPADFGRRLTKLLTEAASAAESSSA